jgi:hypothetical protein
MDPNSNQYQNNLGQQLALQAAHHSLQTVDFNLVQYLLQTNFQ